MVEESSDALGVRIGPSADELEASELRDPTIFRGHTPVHRISHVACFDLAS